MKDTIKEAEEIKKEFLKFYADMSYADEFIPSKEAIIADWWLLKLSEVRKQTVLEIIDDLESNPDTEKWNAQRTISYWIELKQEQLKSKFLKE